MHKILTIWPVVVFVFVIASDELGYNVDYNKLQVAYYDRTLVKDTYFFFGKYNRTNYCLNASFTLLADLEGGQIQSTTSIYQRLNGQYRPMGVEYTYKVCESYKTNAFGIRTQMKKFGNINLCNITKGHYFIYNYMPDESYFPKLVPLGHYMIQMKAIKLDGLPLITLQWFIDSTFKMPKRNFRG